MKKYLRIFQIILIIALLVSLGSFAVNADDDESQVVRVGYMLNYGTIKSPIVKGSEGYGYEYLQTIFKYIPTDYTLEFVYCEWTDAQEMLLNGEIDILGPTTYTEAGDMVYLYPRSSFGDNIIFLTMLKDNLSNHTGMDSINGSTIAVQTNNPNEYMLYEFFAEYGIDANVVYFTENDYENVMENNNYDYCLTSSLQYCSNLSPVVTLGKDDFYYVTSRDNIQLMEDINLGMRELEQNEFMYQEKLYMSYYDYTINSAYIVTGEELSFLQEQEMYYVGVENLYSAICYKDSEGTLAGIAIDVMDMLATNAGINYTLLEIAEDTTDEEIDMLDFAFLSFDEDGREMSHESDPYCQIPFLLIERQMTSGKSIDNIGILTYYGITELQLENHIFGRTIYEYSNAAELQEAYNNGKIDSFIISTATLNLIRDEFEDLNFISNTMDMSLNLTVTFPDDYSNEKIDILNRLIAQLDATEIANSILVHSTPAYSTDVSIMDFYRNHPFIINGIIVLILGGYATLEYKRRRNLRLILERDSLTGLATYHKFVEDATALIAKHKNNTYAIVALDIDNFKHINELYDYETGTEILVRFAENIKNSSPYARIIARTNADNFLMLADMEEMHKWHSSTTPSKDVMEDFMRSLVNDNYVMTFSIGIYEVSNKKLDLSFMIDCANLARGLGKNSASTTVNMFTKEMDSRRISNNDIISSMVHALAAEEFVLNYQPKFDLKTGEILSAEALVRWVRNGKIVPPNDFIPLFERNGFIENLDYYVLDKACQFIKNNPNTPKISVNLSGFTLGKASLMTEIKKVIEPYEISPSKLDIEVTETAFIEKFEQAVANTQSLHAYGFSISMDDFGSGISSLSRLKNISIETLKIDREFIVDCLENPKGEMIIKNVISLAKDLDLETVAEGIETSEQKTFLEGLGCDLGQGYFFARPMTEAEFIKLINK